jgi:hypothetical protein
MEEWTSEKGMRFHYDGLERYLTDNKQELGQTSQRGGSSSCSLPVSQPGHHLKERDLGSWNK